MLQEVEGCCEECCSHCNGKDPSTQDLQCPCCCVRNVPEWCKHTPAHQCAAAPPETTLCAHKHGAEAAPPLQLLLGDTHCLRGRPRPLRSCPGGVRLSRMLPGSYSSAAGNLCRKAWIEEQQASKSTPASRRHTIACTCTGCRLLRGPETTWGDMLRTTLHNAT